MAETTCPFTTSEIKLHLRVDHSVDDVLIAQLMLAATTAAEHYQKRTYITRSRTFYLDEFPSVIRPPYSPLVAVTTLKYYDTDGNQQTLNAANYRVDTDTEPGRITEAYGESWPSIRSMTNAIEVIYTSGYGATSANVPDDIRAAIKMMIAHLYEHRETVSAEQLHEIPMGAKELLMMRRIYN